MATLAGDAAHASTGGPLPRAFTTGLRRLAETIAGTEREDKALALLAAIVGVAVLRRASDDAALADAIQTAVLRLAAVSDPNAAT